MTQGQLKVFVSHSHEDSAFCHSLVQALKQAGADVWYDEHNLGSGRLGPAIEREVRERPIFIVILSSAALRSKWVEDEARWAYGLLRTDTSRIIQPVTAAPVRENDIWLFLQDFKRIEAPGGQPLPLDEAVRRTLRALTLTPAGEQEAAARTAQTSERPAGSTAPKGFYFIRPTLQTQTTGNTFTGVERAEECEFALEVSPSVRHTLRLVVKGDALRGPRVQFTVDGIQLREIGMSRLFRGGGPWSEEFTVNSLRYVFSWSWPRDGNGQRQPKFKLTVNGFTLFESD